MTPTARSLDQTSARVSGPDMGPTRVGRYRSSISSTARRHEVACYGVAPSPAPGASIIGFGAARHFGNRQPLDGAELCGHLELADIRLSQHPRPDLRWRRARQGQVDESLILEWKLRCLDLFVRARTRQALREVAP